MGSRAGSHGGFAQLLDRDDALFFGKDPNSRKARNLRASPEVSCIWRARTTASSSKAPDPGLRREAGGAYAAKYGFDALGGEGGPPVYVLRPRVAFAWLESSFPETTTQWRLS